MWQCMAEVWCRYEGLQLLLMLLQLLKLGFLLRVCGDNAVEREGKILQLVTRAAIKVRITADAEFIQCIIDNPL